VDGKDVEEVWRFMNEEIMRLRNGEGPSFVHARCEHLEGHFLGDQLLRFAHPSMSEAMKMAAPLVKAHTQSKGAPLRERTAALKEVLGIIWETDRKHRSKEGDPIPHMRKKLASMDAGKLHDLETRVQNEIETIITQATLPVKQQGGQRA
jgi:TPP-dependent pyruvate/acetoin dehydrogenase alpha subunit